METLIVITASLPCDISSVDVTYILFHCYLTVCDWDSKSPEASCSLALRAAYSRKITGNVAAGDQAVGLSKSLVPCFSQPLLLLRMTSELKAPNLSVS